MLVERSVEIRPLEARIASCMRAWQLNNGRHELRWDVRGGCVRNGTYELLPCDISFVVLRIRGWWDNRVRRFDVPTVDGVCEYCPIRGRPFILAVTESSPGVIDRESRYHFDDNELLCQWFMEALDGWARVVRSMEIAS